MDNPWEPLVKRLESTVRRQREALATSQSQLDLAIRQMRAQSQAELEGIEGSSDAGVELLESVERASRRKR